MDGSLRTRKDSTAVGNRDGETKRTGLKQPELFEASGLLLPLLFGPVLSCTPPTVIPLCSPCIVGAGGKRGDRGAEGQCDSLQSSLQLLRSFQP